MNEADALDIVQAAIWTVIVASGLPFSPQWWSASHRLPPGPDPGSGMTLTFVPKILAVMSRRHLRALRRRADFDLHRYRVLANTERFLAPGAAKYPALPCRAFPPHTTFAQAWPSRTLPYPWQILRSLPASHEETEETWHNRRRWTIPKLAPKSRDIGFALGIVMILSILFLPFPPS